MMRKLVLFDIDGTLVLTGGAGIRAMNRACEEILGTRDALSGIPVAGRTDRIILTDVVARTGHSLDDGLFAQLRDKYVENLHEEIDRPGRPQTTESLGTRGHVKAVMPGIRELLDALQAREDVFVGLLTGNFEAGARIKLGHFDLWKYFRCGAFGDDAADRNALVPFALDRARACGLGDFDYASVVVIGDTPSDVECARAVGALPVAVATGTYSVDQLRKTGAPIVLEDLSDAEGFVRMIQSPVDTSTP